MKKFFKTVGWILSLPFVLLIFGLRISRVKAKYKKYLTNSDYMPIEVRYKLVYNLVKNVLYIKRYKVSSSGLKNLPQNPGLYVANHKSNIDPLIIFKLLYENARIPYFRFVAKAELNSNNYLSYAFKLVDTIFIDRENIRNTYKKFEEEINLKEDKRSIVIFPEGTRIIDPEKMIDFHEGSFRIAYKFLTPIIPTIIAGSIDLSKDKQPKNYKNKNKIIYVNFLKQIKPQDYATVAINHTTKNIHDLVLAEYLRIFNLIKDNKQNIVVFSEEDEKNKDRRY